MVVRHHEIDFASGALVFPGGSVDPGDLELAARPDRCPPIAGLDAAALSCRVAAVREVFEETGMLLARAGDRLVDGARRKQIDDTYRAALCRGEAGFADLLEREDLTLATEMLVPFAHWITPQGRRKRFDTHFFLAVAPEDQLAAHDGREAVDSVWIRPQDAVAGAAAGTRKLVFPTRMNLSKLAMSPTAAAAIVAARAAPVVTVEPELVRDAEGGRTLRIPAAAGYGGELFLATKPPA